MSQHDRLILIVGVALASCLIFIGSTALAAPKTYELPGETAELKPGLQRGFEAAMNNCLSCHSVDYINHQPSKKGQPFWEAEVQKMIRVYHAPIDEADANAIVDYLANTY
ncbi:SorB family sulfite dehydrogenase c-type cytochrome subunit [Ensifer sp. SL37]|uniref:SorB family sulfite dehydrogenase c-type cytochrome subunit n=1 Tax=Ensifer sp. SL37 TaxID=2995137 RepID=UPI0022758B03|nr:cytochrome c [Ensifer sp. SL37]MCY1740545.1 cytochrome c [Ensifer sp. SL37]